MEITGGSYVVSIPVYEGPMDLLLHLVSKNRIEIHDIPIHEITDQIYDCFCQEGRDRFQKEAPGSKCGWRRKCRGG